MAVIHAIKELQEEGYTFHKRIRIIFGMTEETGNWSDMEYYKQTEDKVDFGFTPDADFPAIYAEMGYCSCPIQPLTEGIHALRSLREVSCQHGSGCLQGELS